MSTVSIPPALVDDPAVRRALLHLAAAVARALATQHVVVSASVPTPPVDTDAEIQ